MALVRFFFAKIGILIVGAVLTQQFGHVFVALGRGHVIRRRVAVDFVEIHPRVCGHYNPLSLGIDISLVGQQQFHDALKP